MKKLLSVLTGKTITPPPIWLMRQAGRHLEEYKRIRTRASDFLSFCYSPSLAAEATLQPIRRYNLDAAILFSDILVIPDALGQKVSFVENIGPQLNSIKTIDDIKSLSKHNFEIHLEPVYETIDLVKDQLPKETTLIGFSGAAWTLAAYMIEGGPSKSFSKTINWATEKPTEFQVLIDSLIIAISMHLNLQVKAGCEVVQIFDTWAGLLSSGQFERWVIEPTKKIIEIVKEQNPKLPIIGFPKGAGKNYKKFVSCTGIDAVSLDSDISLKWVKENLQQDCVVQGNLDNLVLVQGGECLDNNIDLILQILGEKPFVFNLGHGVLPQTPTSHVEQLINRVRKR